MGSQNRADTLFTRLLNVFEIGALVFTGCVVSCNAVAADQSATAVQKSATAQALPPRGTYKIDPNHSFAYFSAWHHIVGVVRGRFDKVSGTITVSEDLAACGVDITIAAYSVSTQNTTRDDDLRGPDFFDVTKFPTMTYQGSGIHRVGENSWKLDGSLTIRGVTKMVPLTFTFKGSFPDTPAGRPMRVAFHGTAETKRGDFGMTRDNLMELGTSPSGSDVEIQIDVEADASKVKPPAI
jgi:polyisoprenoid-binding protein YceI